MSRNANHQRRDRNKEGRFSAEAITEYEQQQLREALKRCPPLRTKRNPQDAALERRISRVEGRYERSRVERAIAYGDSPFGMANLGGGGQTGKGVPANIEPDYSGEWI